MVISVSVMPFPVVESLTYKVVERGDLVILWIPSCWMDVLSSDFVDELV